MVPLQHSPLWTTSSFSVTSLASGARRGGEGPREAGAKPRGDAARASVGTAASPASPGTASPAAGLAVELLALTLENRVASSERCGGVGPPRARVPEREMARLACEIFLIFQ